MRSHRNVYKVVDRRNFANLDLDSDSLLDLNRKSNFDIVPVKQRLSIAEHYQQQYSQKPRNLKSQHVLKRFDQWLISPETPQVNSPK